MTTNTVNRPRLTFLLLAMLVLCAFWAVTAPFIGESNGGIFLVFLSLLIAWPVVAGLVIARWGGRNFWRLGLSVAVVPVTPVALFLLWHVEIAGLVLLRHRFPPPRPMFCNNLVDDERTLLPYWYPPMPVVDRVGHWAWADHQDNLLLVVVLGVPETARVNALASDSSRSRVKIGADREDRYLTLKRTTDALVVILPDGTSRQFVLGPGLAKQFHQTWMSRPVENVLREVGELLGPTEKSALDKFLAGSKRRRAQS
jgi:hypothetical protein